jgi:prepilin-type N-terminal cleavage/methylation domain-containing protein
MKTKKDLTRSNGALKAQARATHSTAFTLVELLVVVTVLAIGSTLVATALGAAGAKSRSFQCYNNLKQIMGAIIIYTHDNNELFPPNPDDGNTVVGHNWCPGQAGPGGPAEFNPDILADPRVSLLAKYLNTNASVFACTASSRKGLYQGTSPGKVGTTVPAARSISMNNAVGTTCPGFDSGGGHFGEPSLSVNGPWLDGAHGHRRNAPWRTYGKTSEIVAPKPANLWVLIEEDAQSINDGVFSIAANTAEWIDFPSTVHNMGCVLAFADGHAEFRKWADPETRVTGGNVARRVITNTVDWLWLARRTTAKAQ